MALSNLPPGVTDAMIEEQCAPPDYGHTHMTERDFEALADMVEGYGMAEILHSLSLIEQDREGA